MEKKSLINFSLSLGKFSLFVDYMLFLSLQRKSAIVCVANVHMFVEAFRDSGFLKIINDSDVVTPDGRPLIWALRILYRIKQERVAGMDLLPSLLEKMTLQNISVYFFGGTQIMLSKTRVYLENKYPKLNIAGFYSPPFSEEQNYDAIEIIDKINDSYPCIVFVVLGCPKQEKWMSSMKDRINTVMIGIGGALPVLIGEQKRAPKWMQKYGLEWFFRLMQEPGRLFKRYATTNRVFIWLMLKEYTKLKLLTPLRFNKKL